MLPEQRAQFEQTMRRLYAVTTFPEGSRPDWNGMKDLFFPWARFTCVTSRGVMELDLAGFQAMYAKLIDDGFIAAFTERETARRVEFVGNAAHVLSAYDSEVIPKGAVTVGRSINSIQMVWSGGRWRIVSMVWDEVLSDVPRIMAGFHSMELVHGDPPPNPA